MKETFNLTYLGLFPHGKGPCGKGMGINMSDFDEKDREQEEDSPETEKREEETITIVKNILLVANYIVAFVVVYLQEEIGMQTEIVQKQCGNA